MWVTTTNSSQSDTLHNLPPSIHKVVNLISECWVIQRSESLQTRYGTIKGRWSHEIFSWPFSIFLYHARGTWLQSLFETDSMSLVKGSPLQITQFVSSISWSAQPLKPDLFLVRTLIYWWKIKDDFSSTNLQLIFESGNYNHVLTSLTSLWCCWIVACHNLKWRKIWIKVICFYLLKYLSVFSSFLSLIWVHQVLFQNLLLRWNPG